MILEIVTPEKKLYSGEINLVKLPSIDGSFEILRNHAPIVSILEVGVIKVIETSGDVKHFEVGGGVVECNDNKIIVLAE